MKRLLRTFAALAVASAATGALVIGLAGGAYAATNPPWEPVGNPPEIGGLIFYNSSGTVITSGSTTTSPFAAYVQGTTTIRSGDTVATLSGYLPVSGQTPAEFSGEQLSGSTTFPNASAPAPLNTSTLPVVTGASTDESIATLESDYPNNDTSSDGYAGIYVLRLTTSATGKAGTTSYDSADISVNNTTNTWSVVYSGTPTTTTLTTSPASPQTQGTSVTLNAAVSPSTATGTVQFKYGTTNIGTAVTVSGGTASTSTTTLPVGTDALSAVFTPASSTQNLPSTGTASYTITAATATTTTLTTSPASPQTQGTSVTLNAAVSPSTATGTVQFEVGTTDIGSPVTVSGGTASTSTTTLPVGTDSLSAEFTPAASSGYAGSTGTASYTITAATATSTSLTATPTSPQPQGTSVTLNAAVTPSAATGTVQFEVGTTDIGSPVTVSGGTASTSTTTLPVGTDSLSAVFTPAASSGYGGSTGTASYTITAVGAITTTSLGVNPSTAPADTAVALTASVTSGTNPLASGSGSVSFYDNGTSTTDAVSGTSTLLGTVALGTGGTATLSYSSFATGAHNIVAEFNPTDSATYAGSTSLVVLFTATAPTVAPDAQSVEVSFPTGALTITTPYTAANPFQLGTAVLSAADATFTASAPFGSATDPSAGVTITDTLAGDQPWTASATVTNFTDGSGDIVNAQNLSFTGVTPSYITGNALQAPDVVTNDITSAGNYAPGASGTDGLAGGPHQFATTAAGDGSVYIYGVLNLVAPSSTPANTYTATITFTIT